MKLWKPWQKIAAGLFVVVILLGVVVGIRYYSYLKIKASGVALVPTADYELVQVPYYLQNDPEWKDHKIGSSSTTMGASGCLISCLASAMDNMGIEVTPGQLNQTLSDGEAFQGADLLWYKIKEAYPQIDYEYSRGFSEETIESLLTRGLLPVVKVRMNGYGAVHWVLIVGASDGKFMVMDPLNKDKTPVPLSEHGGRAYAFRVLVPVGGGS